MTDTKLPMRTRMTQLRTAFVATKGVDSKLVPLVAGGALLALVLGVGLGALAGALILGTVMGLVLGLLVALLLFGWRSQAAAVHALEGRPGAAAAVLQSMRGGYRLTPAVAFNSRQDFVHRVVGRPGVILVAEGGAARVAPLLKKEQRRIAKIVGDTPVHEILVGNGDGQVPLPRLQAHVTRLPRKLKSADVAALHRKLEALGDNVPAMPKGPMPRGRRG